MSLPPNNPLPTANGNGKEPAPANGTNAKPVVTPAMTSGSTTALTPANTVASLPADMVTTPANDVFKDPALISAWRRFLDYDRVSSNQKRTYLKIREYVILLSFLTAAGAVFSVLMQTTTLFSEFQLGVLRLSLVIMPIVSVALNSYASQFASSTAWIEYRVGGETIRQKIYLYRMKAGDFANMPNLQDRQRKLLATIDEADLRIDKAGATLPYMEPLDIDNKPGNSIQERVRSKTDKRYDPANPTKEYDNGFTELPVSKYLDYRIRNQVDWYATRIDGDYSAMQKFRLFALVIAATGSVIASLGHGLEGLVAITTAAGVALNMRADSQMYGATYATYHLTASRLRNELNQWDILTPEEQADPSRAADFVTRMERILSEEREAWRSSAIELQSTADRSVNANIKTEGNSLATPAVKAHAVEMATDTLLVAETSASTSATTVMATTQPEPVSGFPGAAG